MHRYLKIYRRRVHIVVTVAIIMMPLLFVAFVLPFSVVQKEKFLIDLFNSTIRLIVAYGISLVLALVFSLFLTRGKIGAFFLPFFDVMQSFPTFAMLPLVVHWFGPSNITVIIFLIVTIIWPMLFAIISAQKLVKEEWDEAATIFGATGWRRLIYYSLPLSYAGIITGSIVGLGEGWEAVVGAEIIVGIDKNGLGNFFNTNSQSGTIVIFGVLALLVFIFVLNKLIWLPLLEKSHKLLTE